MRSKRTQRRRRYAAPFAPNPSVELRPNYRMLGAIFETESGPYYFRLVGPVCLDEGGLAVVDMRDLGLPRKVPGELRDAF